MISHAESIDMSTGHSAPSAINRRAADICETCRCSAIGSRVCRRGEMGDGPFVGPKPLTDSGLEPAPLVADPSNLVEKALVHFAASLAPDSDVQI